MARRIFSHVVGFDDGSFDKHRAESVPVVGTVFSGTRLEGVLCGSVETDGSDATDVLVNMVGQSKFAPQLQLVLLQGIALGGFNVIDLHALHERLDLPVLVVVRRQPRLDKMRDALLGRVPNGASKWKLIEQLGPMEPVSGVYVQRSGLSLSEAEKVIERSAIHGNLPEPLRTAHLIAGGISAGESRGRP